ncbi:MAG: UDP-2,4-diacetamido-2,4,6-trideoxy-beta-L-altropyranose hydrolase [Pelotomaculum sp. PtaB.Bin013]|nr:MAG: UDP-2,4-diacetamido-2,4,6-trideoxy-beta-L-altropyranose hydrolase [Pelotomaculum sp. PtaB.Bin013]
MNVYIRADASVKIGTGHVIRCLTLAGELRGRGAEVSFICRELAGNLCNYINNKGFKVCLLPYNKKNLDNYSRSERHCLGAGWQADAEQTVKILANEKKIIDWLIVDHYALDEQWEGRIKQHVKKIMVIDDLADRPHACHLLLDQNLYEDMEQRYDKLVPDYCVKLFGPGYALLRPEFREARKNLRKRDGTVRRILIFFGGSDPANQTEKALEAIRLLNRPDIAVDVIVGDSNPNKQRLEEICEGMHNVNYYCQVDNIAQLMTNADLAIGAGGTATWERCYLGLPAIILIIARNQMETTFAVQKKGAILSSFCFRNISIKELMEVIKKAINNKVILQDISKIAMGLLGGDEYKGSEAVLRRMMVQDDV